MLSVEKRSGGCQNADMVFSFVKHTEIAGNIDKHVESLRLERDTRAALVFVSIADLSKLTRGV